MEQDRLWNSEEPHFDDLIPPVPGDLHKDKSNNELSIEPFSTLCFS